MEPSMGDINKPAINHVVFLNALNNTTPSGLRMFLTSSF